MSTVIQHLGITLLLLVYSGLLGWATYIVGLTVGQQRLSKPEAKSTDGACRGYDAGLLSYPELPPDATVITDIPATVPVYAPGAISTAVYLMCNARPWRNPSEFWMVASEVLDTSPIFQSYGFTVLQGNYIKLEVYNEFNLEYDFTDISYFRVTPVRRAEALNKAYRLVTDYTNLREEDRGWLPDDNLVNQVCAQIRRYLSTVPEWKDYAGDIARFLVSTRFPPCRPEEYWCKFEDSRIFTDVVAWLHVNHPTGLFTSDTPYVKGLWKAPTLSHEIG